MESLRRNESRDKGESEEAAVGNESDGRRKEIADERFVKMRKQDLMIVG